MTDKEIKLQRRAGKVAADLLRITEQLHKSPTFKPHIDLKKSTDAALELSRIHLLKS